MADKKYVLRILALALVFGFLVAGCDNGGTWENVTDLTKVAGTWKTSYKTEERAYGGVPMNDFYGIPVDVVDENGDPVGSYVVDQDPDSATYGQIVFEQDQNKITVLTDVEVDTETEITLTIAATSATAGTRTTVTTTKRTYSGDSLETGFGYAVTDPDKTSRNGWSLIKNAEAGNYAPDYAPGFTVTDADYVISFTTPVAQQVPGPIPGTFTSWLLSSDGTMLLYGSGSTARVYIKQ